MMGEQVSSSSFNFSVKSSSSASAECGHDWWPGCAQDWSCTRSSEQHTAFGAQCWTASSNKGMHGTDIPTLILIKPLQRIIDSCLDLRQCGKLGEQASPMQSGMLTGWLAGS